MGVKAALKAVFGTDTRLRMESSTQSAVENIEKLLEELERPVPTLSITEALEVVASGKKDA